MVSSRSSSLLLALTLIILVGVSPAFGRYDCCLSHTKTKFKVAQVGMFEGFYHQSSSGVCDTDAIVFKVNARPCGEPKRISLCADPRQTWVKKMMTAVKKLANRSKKHQQRKRQKLCRRMKKNYV